MHITYTLELLYIIKNMLCSIGILYIYEIMYRISHCHLLINHVTLHISLTKLIVILEYYELHLKSK